MLRILLIEDDNKRVDAIRSWLPEDVRLVHAGSAGRALGILKRSPKDFSGIMLDHDLRNQIATDHDFFLPGSNVTSQITDLVPIETPILIHSMNPADAPRMMIRLEKAGFSVTRVPMEYLTKMHVAHWLKEVREAWADRMA